MSNEGIEVKLVIDANDLKIPLPDECDIVEDVIESTDFENAVDSMCEGWFENSNVYYHEDRLDSLESRLDDMESESNDEEDGDLGETVSALTVRHFALKDRVVALEEGDSFFTDVRYAHLKEAVSDLQEWNFDEMQDDLNRDEVAIDMLQKRVDELEKVLPEDSGNSMAMLILRVERLEMINERLLHIIHNVQGVDLP
tara:strand:- start:380 stop:973 length:594 start_codon:yes stop_codon:yes gene_type:complete